MNRQRTFGSPKRDVWYREGLQDSKVPVNYAVPAVLCRTMPATLAFCHGNSRPLVLPDRADAVLVVINVRPEKGRFWLVLVSGRVDESKDLNLDPFWLRQFQGPWRGEPDILSTLQAPKLTKTSQWHGHGLGPRPKTRDKWKVDADRMLPLGIVNSIIARSNSGSSFPSCLLPRA